MTNNKQIDKAIKSEAFIHLVDKFGADAPVRLIKRRVSGYVEYEEEDGTLGVIHRDDIAEIST
jgi:hypothetical protein